MVKAGARYKRGNKTDLKPDCVLRAWDPVVTLAAGVLAVTTSLVQKPCLPFCLVNPSLKQTCAGHIAILVAHGVRFEHIGRQLFVVVAKLSQHIKRCNVVGVIVEDLLQPADLPD